MEPYYADGTVSLYVGDCREILPALGVTADCIVTDPPYSSTSLAWDRWPEGWLQAAATVTRSMWCFLPLRQFAEPPYRGIEFREAGWKLSQDNIWEKGNGSGPGTPDRFLRVHEQAAHWYQGPWSGIYHEVPRVAALPGQVARNGHASRGHLSVDHRGSYGSKRGWADDGTRFMRSVLFASTMRGRAIHETEKPLEVVTPMLCYACPPGGLVVDPYAGSCSTLEAARRTGRRAIGIELRECCAEKAVRERLSKPVPPVQGALFGGEAS